MQVGIGHLSVYYTCPQCFMIMFSYYMVLKLWLLLLNFKFTICNLRAEWEFLCIIIGDVHKFISHCLISLDPCKPNHKRILTFINTYWSISCKTYVSSFTTQICEPKYILSKNVQTQKMPIVKFAHNQTSLIFKLNIVR